MAMNNATDRANLKVTYDHEKPPYWEVTHTDGRWWSVAYNPQRHTYLITNAVGRQLDEHGPTGQKIINAVHDHERGTT